MINLNTLKQTVSALVLGMMVTLSVQAESVKDQIRAQRLESLANATAEKRDADLYLKAWQRDCDGKELAMDNAGYLDCQMLKTIGRVAETRYLVYSNDVHARRDTYRIAELTDRVEKLQARLDALEAGTR